MRLGWSALRSVLGFGWSQRLPTCIPLTRLRTRFVFSFGRFGVFWGRFHYFVDDHSSVFSLRSVFLLSWPWHVSVYFGFISGCWLWFVTFNFSPVHASLASRSVIGVHSTIVAFIQLLNDLTWITSRYVVCLIWLYLFLATHLSILAECFVMHSVIGSWTTFLKVASYRITTFLFIKDPLKAPHRGWIRPLSHSTYLNNRLGKCDCSCAIMKLYALSKHATVNRYSCFLFTICPRSVLLGIVLAFRWTVLNNSVAV